MTKRSYTTTMVIYYDDNGHILRRQWSYTTKMVKYHENGHIRRKWPYTTNMVIYLKAWCATAGSGSSSSGRQLGRCGSGRYCASLTGSGSPSSGRQLRRGGSGWWVCHSCRKQSRKKHRIEENYSSEVSPPSREKKS